MNTTTLLKKDVKEILSFLENLSSNNLSSVKELNLNLICEEASFNIRSLKESSNKNEVLYWYSILITTNKLLVQVTEDSFKQETYKINEIQSLVMKVRFQEDNLMDSKLEYQYIINWLTKELDEKLDFNKIKRCSQNVLLRGKIEEIRNFRLLKMKIKVLKMLKNKTSFDLPPYLNKWITIYEVLP